MRNKLFATLVVFVIISSFFVLSKNFIKTKIKKNPITYQLAKKGKTILYKDIPHFWKRLKPKRKLQNITIQVDVSKCLEKYEQFWGGFGQDYFYSGVTLTENKEFFKLVAKTNAKRKVFNYYRAHNIFSDRNAPNGELSGGKVYNEDENGNPFYNWERVDRVFDTIISSGLKPIVELGFMPEALTTNPNRLGDWNAANVAPPRDYLRWRNLIYETIKHLEQRYGKKEIESWYFEVWNEPDLYYFFWIEDPHNPYKANLNEYYKLYDYTVDGAVAANPNIKIGGPAIAGWDYVFEGFLNHVINGKNYVTGSVGSRVDFVSFHKYGNIDETILPNIKYLIQKGLDIDKKKCRLLPFLLSEFGPATSSTDQWKNTRYVAVWVSKMIDSMFELGYKEGLNFRPSVMIYWSGIGKNYVDGAGMLATTLGSKYNIIKGPVFNAYHAFSFLSKERISLKGTNYGDEVHGIATRDRSSSIEILIYRINDVWSRTKDSIDVNLIVRNLPDKEYFEKIFIIDETHSNAFACWKKMGRPTDPSQEQIITLKNKSNLELFEPISKVKAVNNSYFKKLKLQSNSLVLLILSKITDFIAPNEPLNLTVSNLTYNSLLLDWSPPKPSIDGDIVSSYLIFRNDSLLLKTFSESFQDTNLVDNTIYQYKIYAVDDQGNISKSPLIKTLSTPEDSDAPQITSILMPNDTTLVLQFSESLEENSAKRFANYNINNGIQITRISYYRNQRKVVLNTTPHSPKIFYTIYVKNVKDKAKNNNVIKNYYSNYKYSLHYSDNFDINSIMEYNWKHLFSEGGFGKCHYDENNLRMEVLTGDNIEEQFSHWLPESDKGFFVISFLPYKKYPNGGQFTINLKQDSENYYRISNTDGYGTGLIKKIVNGIVVDSTFFSNEYKQQIFYNIRIEFSPKKTTVKAFNNLCVLHNNYTPIFVRKFEVAIGQQDAFFDNIRYNGKNGY